MQTYGGESAVWPAPAAGWPTGGDRGPRHGCYGPGEEEEIEQARAVARRLGIEHHRLDVREAYRREVLDYYRAEYQAGRTPNPCVRCNRTVKFGALLEQARASGLSFDRFATGHYARCHYDAGRGRYVLRRGSDRRKDQSYFLSALRQDQLAGCLFPLGEAAKSQVRALAAGLGLGLEDEPESQDFAEGLHAAFFDAAAEPGPIVDREGRRLGTHRGIAFYTIGQRRGLGVAAPHPLYVTAIDAAHNRITVGPREDVAGRGLRVTGMNWVSIAAPRRALHADAQIRYQHAAARAEIRPRGRREADVVFFEPQHAITPGQIVALYEGETLLGAGTISQALRPPLS